MPRGWCASLEMWRAGPGGVRREWKPLYARRSITLIEGMRAPAEPSAPIAHPPPADEPAQVVASCDYCGSARLEWRKCKLICADCKQINKSCADL